MQARATATKGDQSRAPYEAGALRSRLRSRAQRSGLQRFCFLSSACLACLRSKPSPLPVSPGCLPCMQARQRPSKGDRSKAAVREFSRALRFDFYRGKARGFKLVWVRGEDVVTVRGGGSSSSGGTLSLYPSISVSRSRSRSSSYSALASAAATQPQQLPSRSRSSLSQLSQPVVTQR